MNLLRNCNELNKIDLSLLNKVVGLGDTSCFLDAIVYVNSMDKAKKYLSEKGIKIIDEYPFINAIAFSGSVSEIRGISRLSIVEYITSLSRVCTLSYYAKNFMNLKDDFSQNNDFTCAVIDTGVDNVVDLKVPNNRVVKFVDLVNKKESMYDDNGHGTMVCSAISGSGVLSSGKYKGLGGDTNLVVIKALDKNGEATATNILYAMQWIIDNYEKYKIRVVCMSFGSQPLVKKDPLMLGAEALWNSGLVVVTACGNSGPSSESIKSPASSTKVISVGAIYDGRYGGEISVADFSSRGPIFGNYKPDIVVSGVDIVTASNYSITHKHYDKMSGTSIATPMVAGVCCRILKRHPEYSPNQVKKELINHCVVLFGDRNSEGFGYLDMKYDY